MHRTVNENGTQSLEIHALRLPFVILTAPMASSRRSLARVANTGQSRLGARGIQRFWTDQAAAHGLSPSASWSDTSVIQMEIREMLRFLDDGDKVLDLGCANGFSTVAFAAQKRIHIKGIDYIPGMIRQARLRLAAQRPGIRSRVQFAVGDVMHLGRHAAETYDKVISTRVLINLGEWSRQRRALRQWIGLLKPGGLLLLSEATRDGWKRLNDFRREWGLTAIPEPAFNNYIDERAVARALAPRLSLVEVSNFASTYYVGTRVLKPLIARALNMEEIVANPAMHWNHWFSSLPACGVYGVQKLLVFQRR
jgi:ubiquinone/menaquinone biosynthesis C-methylase UbiE